MWLSMQNIQYSCCILTKIKCIKTFQEVTQYKIHPPPPQKKKSAVSGFLHRQTQTDTMQSQQTHFKIFIVTLLLLSLALQPRMGFSLLSDSLPFCSFLILLSPPFYSYYLNIFFDIYDPSLPWSSSNSCTYRFPL